MKLVVIESPYAGDVQRNLRYLDAAQADCFARGEAPFASHGLYTRKGVLDDRIPDERARGMRAGFAWGEKADLVAVYEDLGVTPGMLAGIERAEKRGQRVERRRIPGWGTGTGFFGNITDEPRDLATTERCWSLAACTACRAEATAGLVLMFKRGAWGDHPADADFNAYTALWPACALHEETMHHELEAIRDRSAAVVHPPTEWRVSRFSFAEPRVFDNLYNSPISPKAESPPAPHPGMLDDDPSDPEFDSDPDDGGD